MTHHFKVCKARHSLGRRYQKLDTQVDENEDDGGKSWRQQVWVGGLAQSVAPQAFNPLVASSIPRPVRCFYLGKLQC